MVKGQAKGEGNCIYCSDLLLDNKGMLRTSTLCREFFLSIDFCCIPKSVKEAQNLSLTHKAISVSSCNLACEAV